MKRLILLVSLLLSYTTFSQEDTLVYEAPDTEAEFPGGFNALMEWINNNVVYPEYVLLNPDCHSKTFIEFVVEKDGSLSNFKMRNKCNSDLSYYTVLFNKSPKWIPAQNKGVIVRSRFRLPLTVELR
jgi:hypothetical protein